MSATRRRFLLWLTLFSGLLPFSSVCWAQEKVHIRWTLPKADSKTVSNGLHFEGEVITVEDGENVTKGVPAVVLVGIVVVTYLLETLRQIYDEHFRAGVEIECTSSGLNIREEPQLLAGTVVVKDCRGEIQLYDMATLRRSEGWMKLMDRLLSK